MESRAAHTHPKNTQVPPGQPAHVFLNIVEGLEHLRRRQKKIICKEYFNEKNSWGSKITSPDNFSHGPSLNKTVLEYPTASRFVRPQPRIDVFFFKQKPFLQRKCVLEYPGYQRFFLVRRGASFRRPQADTCSAKGRRHERRSREKKYF